MSLHTSLKNSRTSAASTMIHIGSLLKMLCDECDTDQQAHNAINKVLKLIDQSFADEATSKMFKSQITKTLISQYSKSPFELSFGDSSISITKSNLMNVIPIICQYTFKASQPRLFETAILSG